MEEGMNLYMPNDCLMGGAEITGGNWSAHCISTWQWITICFIVCVRHDSFSHPSIRSFVRSDYLQLSC